jgi:hypothetical protein
MVSRKRIDVPVDPATDNSAHFTQHSLASGSSRPRTHKNNDELISVLSEAYENKRARQVNEWERRQNVRYLV